MTIIIGDYDPITNHPGSLFETILIEGYRPVLWEKHRRRLKKAVYALYGVSLNWPSIDEELKALPYPKMGAMRMVYHPSSDVMNIAFKDNLQPDSDALSISKVVRDGKALRFRYKTDDYGQRLQDLDEARSNGFLDLVYRNEDGYLCGGAVSNLYFFRTGRIHTPSLENGVLNGIVREVLMDELDCIEGNYTLDDLMASEGVFITNSLMGIRPIGSIDGHPMPKNERAIEEVNAAYRGGIRKEANR